MIVFYRMATNESLHEERRPRYSYDKFNLAKMCLKSFIEAFSDVKPTMKFLLDRCPPKWDEMIKEVMPWEYEIEHLDFGSMFKTIPYQWEKAKDLDDYILFQEDDYVYLKGTGKKMLDALKLLEFVSPYDHGEYYTINREYHKGPFDIKLIGDQHWRTIDFTTMTWGCHSNSLIKHWKALNGGGYWDKETFQELGKVGAKLWSPIPGLATHMHKDFLSPGIDWERRFSELDK